jgi:LysM repeat protein
MSKEKRKRQLQKRVTLGLVTAVLVIAFSILYGSLYVNAEGIESARSQKYYTSIEVQYGETLWAVAERYIDYAYYADIGAYIKEVKRINHLRNDEIKAGCYLVVPYYAEGESAGD